GRTGATALGDQASAGSRRIWFAGSAYRHRRGRRRGGAGSTLSSIARRTRLRTPKPWLSSLMDRSRSASIAPSKMERDHQVASSTSYDFLTHPPQSPLVVGRVPRRMRILAAHWNSPCRAEL